MVSKADCAYAAGFVDGEGTITLKMSNGRAYPGVFVENTNREVLEWLRRTFNLKVNIYIRKRSKKSRQRKTCYCIHIGRSKKIVEFLKLIAPHLKVKKEQATIVLTFCAEHVSYQPETQREQMLHMQIRELNRKGGKGKLVVPLKS